MLLLAALVGAPIGPARGQENRQCLECHGDDEDWQTVRDGRTIPLYVDAERLGRSVHAGLDCVACHEDLAGAEFPHAVGLKPVMACAECHEKSAELYAQSIHGRRLAAGESLAPRCFDCHGNHYIPPVAHRDSPTAPFNIPAMCAQCHAEGAPVERTFNIPQDQIVERYKESIHGEGLFRQGLVVTAVCTSCHTGHEVLPHDDPRSSISRGNVSGTCMKCHGLIEQVHRKIINGTLWEKEPNKIPICVECHAPHEVRKARYDTGLANADCLYCHGNPDLRAANGRPLFVDEAQFAASVHGREPVACAQCHTGVTTSLERACATITGKVDCSVCHEQQASDYWSGIHGRLQAQGDTDAPTCTDCHGLHDTLEHEAADGAPESVRQAVRGSPIFASNVPRLCARCHREGGKAAVRYRGEEHEIVEHYVESIHGQGLLSSGLTATCADCHTPHRELPRSDPESSVNPARIAATCGRCHDPIYEKYAKSVHSPEGNPDYHPTAGMPTLPGCADCHSSHSVQRAEKEVFLSQIVGQCGKCHAEVTESYFDTQHGKSWRLGLERVAKCYDCHGTHDARRVADPQSTLSRANIVATCGQCHAGSNRRFAGYLTHATHHDPRKYPALFYTFWGMTGLLTGTFTFFGLHTLIWLPRSWRMRKELLQMEALSVAHGERQFVRFAPLARKLHATMIVSFFGLALTGMTLKFSYMGWAQGLSWLLGGVDATGFMHRACAVVMFGVAAVHLVSALGHMRSSGKSVGEFLFGANTILPCWNDVREFGATVRWFFGRGPRPHYGRWTYWEKFDYLAVFWGIVVIGSTGLFLWFPEFFTSLHLPGWLINVATIVHSDEALLATGFIFTIHFFNTHFRPEKFPMDTVIFTGRMPLEELKHERPREYEELVARGLLEQHLAPPAPQLLTRGVMILGFTALGVGLCLVVLIIYSMLFGYR